MKTRQKTNLPGRRVVILEGAESSVATAAELLEIGRRLRALYLAWTVDDEEPGECANSGSGADICEDVFRILTDSGYPIA